jgi:hypothetical protein
MEKKVRAQDKVVDEWRHQADDLQRFSWKFMGSSENLVSYTLI